MKKTLQDIIQNVHPEFTTVRKLKGGLVHFRRMLLKKLLESDFPDTYGHECTGTYPVRPVASFPAVEYKTYSIQSIMTVDGVKTVVAYDQENERTVNIPLANIEDPENVVVFLNDYKNLTTVASIS